MKTKNLLIVILMALMMPVGAWAQSYVSYTDPSTGFKYSIWTGKEPSATVTGYTGSETALTIPESVVYNSKTYRVFTIGAGAFENNTNLISVTLPSHIVLGQTRTIMSRAFKGCSNLETVNLSGQYESIGSNAFEGCTSLTSISIPESVTTIGTSAFEGCTSLTSAILPDGLTTLGTSAFKGCASLTQYSFGGLTSIPESAYEGCTSIASIGTGSITAIGANAFKDCTGLINVDVYTRVQSIDPTAFGGCDPDEVTYSIWPINGNTTVAEGLFSDCQGIGKVVLADGITAVGANAFKDCISFYRITLTTTTRSIGADAFTGCSAFAAIINSSGGDDDKTIADDLFKNVTLLVNVTINDGVTAVGERAFQGCSVQYIDLPPSVTTVEAGAFADCGKLSAVRLYTTMESFSPTALSNYRSIEIMATADDTTVDANVFKDCTGLLIVAIDDGVTALGASAFEGCTLLTTVYLPANLTSLPSSVFAGCTKLETIGPKDGNVSYNIGLPATMQSIGESAFEGAGLKTIIIPEGLTQIGQKAFAACSSLNKVTVESSTPPVLADANVFDATTYASATLTIPLDSKSAYQQATGWKEFVSMKQQPGVVADNQGIQYAYYPDDGYAVVTSYTGTATSIVIPETVTGIGGIVCTVTTIGNWAFASAAIESVFLPSTVTTIESAAFASSNIKEIDIPASVKTIQMYAFDDCASLTKVKVNWTVATSTSSSTTSAFVARNAFGDNVTMLGNVTLQVPEGTTNIYNNVEPWKNFGNIVDIFTYVENGVVYALDGDAMQVVGWQGTLPSTLNIPQSITVNDTSYPVTSIAAGAFLGNTDITKVSFHLSQTSIGAIAFRNCYNLTNVTMPTTMQSIAADAFLDCNDNLTMDIVVLDYFHTSVPASFLEGAYGIHHVNLYGVEAIGDKAFKNCSSLESITIPTTVSSIARSAFDGTTSLTKVIVKWTSASEIVNNGTIFYDQYRTATLYVPTGTKALYSEAESWKDFSKIVDNIDFADDDVEAICVANWDTDNDGGISSDEAAAVTNLNQVFKANTDIKKFQELRYFTGLTKIGVSDFEGCTSLEIVELPTSVTKILTKAFYGCSSLQGISGGYQFIIPVQVTSIGEEAFANCRPASRIQIFGPAVIEARAFAGSLIDSSDSQVYITSALNSIATDAFDETGALFYINSSNDTPIGVWLFKDCTFLKNLSVNAPVEANAFMGCTNLRNVIFSDGVTSIGASAFQGCSQLQEVELPWTLQTVSVGAFSECTALSKVTINAQVTSIDKWAFSRSTNLQTIIVKAATPPSLVESAFDNTVYNTATLFVLEESAQAYGATSPWSKFKNWGVIDSQGIRYTYATVDDSPKATVVGYNGWATDLVIAGSVKGHDGQVYPVKEINTYPAFELARNYFTSITIPASMTTIQEWAFAENVNLKTVKVGWSDPRDLSIIPRIFNWTLINPNPDDPENTNGEGILYVPAGTTALYQSTAPWSYFKTFIEYQPGNANGDDDNTIDINDVLAIVDYILGKNVPATFNAAAADVNGDGRVTIADAAAVVNIILGTGN